MMPLGGSVSHCEAWPDLSRLSMAAAGSYPTIAVVTLVGIALDESLINGDVERYVVLYHDSSRALENPGLAV